MEFDFAGILQFLQIQAANPVNLFFLIIIATFILEDPATVAAAFIALEGSISPFWALIALYIGIFVGDLGLYGLGRLATKSAFIRKQLQRRGLVSASNWLNGWMVSAILSARFAPGMRLPTYTACGLFELSFSKFAMTTFLAVSIWTTILFFLSYFLGEYVIEQLGEWRWYIAIAIIIAAIFLPRLLRYLPFGKLFKKHQYNAISKQ